MHDFVVDLLLMHEIFEPMAQVMTKVQGISLSPWKIPPLIEKLVDWLNNASSECHENGNMDYFPTTKKNIQVIYVCVLFDCVLYDCVN